MVTMEENKKDLFTENPPSRSVEALLGEKRTSCINTDASLIAFANSEAFHLRFARMGNSRDANSNILRSA
jgi:hypothetical protein